MKRILGKHFSASADPQGIFRYLSGPAV